MMKNGIMRIRRMMFLAVMLLFVLAVTPPRAQAATVQLSKTSKTVYQSTWFKLKLKNAKGTVKWTSSNEKVATVFDTGVVKSFKPGKAVIRAKYKKKTYKCTVTVRKVKMQPTKLTMVKGRTASLSLSRSNIPARWVSSNTTVATVDQNGKVKTLTPGTVTITAGYRQVYWTCKLTVLAVNKANLAEAYPATKANRKKIVLAGSSSVDFWSSAPEAFAPYEIINTAIAGSTVTQWLNWYKTLITRYKPSAVVLYVGSNDLGAYRTAGKTNAANTITLLKSIRKQLKGVPIFYVSVVPCYVYKHAWAETAVSNQLVAKWCEKTSDVYYIGLNTKFRLADGTPNRSLFRDQLHPNDAGYALWKKYVARRVIKEVKNRAKN